MAGKFSESRDYLFQDFQLQPDSGMLQPLTPPPRKKPTIPSIYTTHTIGRFKAGRDPQKAVKSPRTTKQRSSGLSPHARGTSSTRDVRVLDRQISIGSPNSEAFNSESSIPITVEIADDSSQNLSEIAETSDVSTGSRLSSEEPREASVSFFGQEHQLTTWDASTASSSDSESALGLSISFDYQSHSNYDFLTPGNSLDPTLNPRHERVHSEANFNSEHITGSAGGPLPWALDNVHSYHPSSAQSSAQLARAYPNIECTHSYNELIWTFRCSACGCHLPLDVLDVLPIEFPALADQYELLAPLTGTFSWTPHPDMTHTHTHNLPLAAANQSGPTLSRLTIPDTASYRAPPSAISASASSATSSEPLLTPESALSRDNLSPGFEFASFDSMLI